MVSEIGQVPGEDITPLQHSEEFLEEVNSAVVRQTSMVTSDFDISWQIWHVRELLTLSSQFAEPSAIQQMPIPLGQNTIAGHCLAPDRSIRDFMLVDIV